MPKTPITISIVPSRLALLVHAAMAMVVAGLVVWYAPTEAAVITVALLGLVVLHVARCRPRGELRASWRDEGGLRWQWRDGEGSPRREVTLCCDYLGPWLIGITVDGRRLWLWPDGSDTASLRALRRVLVTPR